MPRHTHGLNKASTSNPNSDYKTVLTDRDSNINTLNGYISYTGNSQPHNNMPPYYALCFIMKL